MTDHKMSKTLATMKRNHLLFSACFAILASISLALAYSLAQHDSSFALWLNVVAVIVNTVAVLVNLTVYWKLKKVTG